MTFITSYDRSPAKTVDHALHYLLKFHGFPPAGKITVGRAGQGLESASYYFILLETPDVFHRIFPVNLN